MDLAGPVPELKSQAASSSGSGSTSKPDDTYLSDFTRLGEQVYYYVSSPTSISTPTPPTSSTADVVATASASASATGSSAAQEPTADPGLIIICSWMYAQPRHIAKYSTAYRAKYTSSPILLLRQDGGDFFWRTHATQMRNLEPAIRVIRRLQADATGHKLRVLMHVFSNGGAWSACQLADAYALACRGDHDAILPGCLPLAALILDSTPSLPDPAASHAAICEALPSAKTYPLTRKTGEIAVSCFLALTSALDALLGREHLTLNIRRRLNDPQGAFMQSGLHTRAYIYSEADALIPATDVEVHAEEARAILRARQRENKNKENQRHVGTSTHLTPNIGDDRRKSNGRGDKVSDDGTGCDIWLEKFDHTRHVGHMQGDPGRYWAVIDKVWKGGSKD
ncbi:hypothetical protein A1O7_08818 [Cladophialophora yegresii CBS 114405]|uniref:Uncharacterized protein n=1 Tax=Cladophialophora yegresii CBS 114405 TaxID=1182544 RepID=W9VJQ4_9EURO|nr:uncharacterized protein A1O7_08818 [Cladophialophora yegresii CBS 114405]EXJ55887.1 hypothetical protein A1O7_08818 [Cladophialophora yegresii CBS 114405]